MKAELLIPLLVAMVGCAPANVGEACDRIMRAQCEHAGRCLSFTATEVRDCISVGVRTCCADQGVCGRPLVDPEATGRCVTATADQDCFDWKAWAAGPRTTAPPVARACVGAAAVGN